MENRSKALLALVLPYAVWMALMFALPHTAASYAIRSAATLVALAGALFLARGALLDYGGRRIPPAGTAIAVIAGAAVCAVWIWLPAWPFPEPAAPNPSPYSPDACGWPLTVAKLAGSALAIAPAEELFFRSFLYRRLVSKDFLSVKTGVFDLQAFLWTVLLFTLEHDRPVAAAIAGAAYGAIAIRSGIVPAIIAHSATNLLLGLHVIFKGAWQFW